MRLFEFTVTFATKVDTKNGGAQVWDFNENGTFEYVPRNPPVVGFGVGVGAVVGVGVDVDVGVVVPVGDVGVAVGLAAGSGVV